MHIYTCIYYLHAYLYTHTSALDCALSLCAPNLYVFATVYRKSRRANYVFLSLWIKYKSRSSVLFLILFHLFFDLKLGHNFILKSKDSIAL